MPSVVGTVISGIEGTSRGIEVSYPVREAKQTITGAEYDLIKSLTGEKVKCIKFIREQYTLGLYEAKQIVDTIHAHNCI
jgi:ribosomal protein L7/L12